MRFSTKTKYSFLAFLFAIGLMGCGDSSIAPVIDGPSSPKYLLDGTLSNVTDANGFAYYTNGNEAYVARGTNTSTTPEIPDEVTLGGKTYSVTGVYHSGFAKADITSITLPLSIETIDYQAFANSQLTSVTIPCNVEAMGSGAFMNCHSLAAVQFKNDNSSGSSTIGVCGGGGGGGGGPAQGSSHLRILPDYCFFNCESLTTISFPRTLTTVDSCAFSNCVGLTKLAFLHGFTTLKTLAFESCDHLTDVYFPSTFTSATEDTSNCEPGAFYKVNSSCQIHLSTETGDIYETWHDANSWRYYDDSNPLNVAERLEYDVGLGNDYLYRVEEVTEDLRTATVFSYAPSSFPGNGVVVMPNTIDGYNVTKAEVSTYSTYLTRVKQIYLSKNLEFIENGFFAGMTQLTTVSSTGDGCYTPTDNAINLGAMTKLTEVGTNLFSGATYMTNTFSGTLTLPVNLVTIGLGAFQDLSKGTKIAFASGDSKLATIGSQAFMNFGVNRDGGYGDSFGDGTFELSLPGTCTSVGSKAFYGVCGLKKIIFKGNNQTSLSIGSEAFSLCRTLCEIEFPAERTDIQIGEKAFYCCSSGAAKGFSKISGIQAVFFPTNVSKIGSLAFACNERACFFFENSNITLTNNGVYRDNFNQVFYEGAGKSVERINSVKDNNYIGIRESNGIYTNVGFNDGASSGKKRYIQTDDFCFVETDHGSGDFICARYRYKPEGLPDNAHVTVKVPEYIKYTPSEDDAAYAGLNSTDNSDFKVVSIGDSCFSSSYSRDDKGLSEVEVPHAITRIGDNAFLRSFFFNKLTSYTGANVSVDYTFPSSLEYIGRSAFACCRLKKALSIPGDVKTFDMISTEALNSRTFPFSLTDGTSPRLYTTNEVQPAAYSSIFANDWLLERVTFTTVNEPTMYFDETLRALYRLKEYQKNKPTKDSIQLLMVCGRLSDFSEFSGATITEADCVAPMNVTIGETSGYTIKENTESVRYGAWRMANWAKGLMLDTTITGLFATNYGKTTLIPQALLTACVKLPFYLNIGVDGNDEFYNVATTSFGLTASGGETKLPPGVLRNATNVTSMTIPGNLSEISDNAFDRASAITNWYTPNSSGTLQRGGEAGGSGQGLAGILDMRYNTSLKRIGTSAFWGANGITHIYFPPNLEDLGSRSAFERNSSGSDANSPLVYVDMSTSSALESIPERTFQAHQKLATVILPPNLKSIGKTAFAGCRVSNITWPANGTLTTILDNAFKGSRMTSLQIPNGVTTIGTGAFQDNTSLTSLQIPGTVGKIGNSAFQGNTALTDLQIADDVQEIGDSAFQGDSSLQILRLPTALKSGLGYSQFKSCSTLNQVYFSDVTVTRNPKHKLATGCFPSSVKYAMLPAFIEDGSSNSKPFSNCSNLKAIFYGGTTPSGSTQITSYGNNNAPIYYYVENAGSIPSGTELNYWTPKPGEPWVAQVLNSDGTVKASYDFKNDILQ